MPLYEIGLIIDPEATPEEESSTLERIESIITDAEGEVVDKDGWGRRQLAYPIKKKNHGIYHFWKFEVGGQVLDAINFELRTNDMVMRSLVLNLDRELCRHRKGERLIKAKAAKRAAKAKAVAEEAAEAS
jgi:small subunit ribosomal protein S6